MDKTAGVSLRIYGCSSSPNSSTHTFTTLVLLVIPLAVWNDNTLGAGSTKGRNLAERSTSEDEVEVF